MTNQWLVASHLTWKSLKKAFSLSSASAFILISRHHSLSTSCVHALLSSPTQLEVEVGCPRFPSVDPHLLKAMEQGMRTGHAADSVSGPMTSWGEH